MLGAFGKRAIDVVIGAALLILVLPVIVVCAVGTAIALRSWPFFSQMRVGRDGKEFRFFKLRTLPPHAPRYASKYEIVDLKIPRFTLALRRLHLDELPQLILVVIGKMSLVGPRPEMAHLYGNFTPEFAAQRTSMRPGCTGLWQISDCSSKMISQHPEFDRHYLAHHSIRFDLWIIMTTIRIFVSRGSQHVVSLDTIPAWAGARMRPETSPGGATVLTIPEPRRESTLEPAMQAAEA